MKIEHVAVWTQNLERLKDFYKTYFEAEAGVKYVNKDKEFESYFLTFRSGARLELMRSPAVVSLPGDFEAQPMGYAHLAFSAGSEEQVDRLTARLRVDGYQIVSVPRRTGDGYYESAILDPDGNKIEITI